MSRIQKTHYINLRWRLVKIFVIKICSAVNIMHYVDYIMVLMLGHCKIYCCLKILINNKI